MRDKKTSKGASQEQEKYHLLKVGVKVLMTLTTLVIGGWYAYSSAFPYNVIVGLVTLLLIGNRGIWNDKVKLKHLTYSIIGLALILFLSFPDYHYRFLPVAKLQSFNSGLAGVKRGFKESTSFPLKCGFIDENGKVVIDYKYDEVGICSNGLIPVKQENKWGVIDSKGELVLPIEYDFVGNAINSFFAALRHKDNRPYIYFYEREKFLKKVEGKYTYTSNIVKKEDWFFEDKVSDLLVGPIRDPLLHGNGKAIYYFYSEGSQIEVRLDSTFIDTLSGSAALREMGWAPRPNIGFVESEVIIDGAICKNISDGYVFYKDGFFNLQGEKKIHWEFDIESSNKLKNNRFPLIFKEGLCAIPKDGRFGYIDKNGNPVIPFLFENALPFHEGLAAVNAGAGWYFINKAGSKIGSETYDSVSSFSGGRAKVRQGNNTFFIDRNDQCVLFCK